MRHNATKRVHLFDDMALADAPYRRITRHLADGIEPIRDQQCAGAYAGCSQRCFGARMPAPDYEDFNWSVCWHFVRKSGSIRFVVVVARNDGSFEQIGLFVRNVFPPREQYVRIEITRMGGF